MSKTDVTVIKIPLFLHAQCPVTAAAAAAAAVAVVAAAAAAVAAVAVVASVAAACVCVLQICWVVSFYSVLRNLCVSYLIFSLLI